MQKFTSDKTMEMFQGYAHLSLSSRERLIIIDSCIFVEDTLRHGRILTTLTGKCGKYKLKLFIPRIVLYEVSKVTSTPREILLDKISKTFKQFKIAEQTNDIEFEAKRLETQFYECHRSDSIILATARITGAILVTLDQKLLRTAQLEGVEAYHLQDFIKNWRILN